MSDYIEKMQKWNELEKAVRDDKRYSDFGKERELEKLRAEKLAYGTRHARTLREAVIKTSLAVVQAQNMAGELSEWSAGGFDFERLNYEMQKCKTAIGKCDGSSFDVRELWESILERGDKHEIKAWVDHAAGFFPQTDNDIASADWAALSDDIVAEIEFTKGPEQIKVEAAKAAALDELAAIEATAVRVGHDLGLPRGDARRRIFHGVRFEDGLMSTSFEKQRVERSNGDLEFESDDELYIRLEMERRERIKPVLEFDDTMNPEFVELE